MLQVSLKGVKELQRFLKNAEKKYLIRGIREGSKKGSRAIRDDARRHAPRKTGLLARKIKTKVMKRKQYTAGCRTIIPKEVYYGWMQDKGFWLTRRSRWGYKRKIKKIEGKYFIKDAGWSQKHYSQQQMVTEITKSLKEGKRKK